ncbi:NB-ARC domain-containing protein [Kribbella lupini]|uniref:AAA+ ATPase domain-containing protein n=1 Tax=Kribbella lupini TaxID=291602 RepID=A0ABN2AQ65_9ACTN
MRGRAVDSPPDPGEASTLAELVERLRVLKVWAGDPSYDVITTRINAAWQADGRPAGELARRTTVADCFRQGRRRVNTELVAAIVRALHPDPGAMAHWRQALRVITGEVEAAAQVRVQDELPGQLAEFTGRTAELDRLAKLLTGPEPVAIVGMAGVGKSQLATRIGHLLRGTVERVLFVNLRGFHGDESQPPAEPGAVLDGFLRLLGVPGHKVPHGLVERAALYRQRLQDRSTLVILDNAADELQLEHLLPGVPSSRTLVTSRRDLNVGRSLTVQSFSTAEAIEYLALAVPGVEVGSDPDAAARIARRCGHLPLALGLVAGHMRTMAGWTLTDHADRLDERHGDQRLDTEVTLALDLSYQRLPDDLRRLLRLLTLHPGPDFGPYDAAALGDLDPGAASSVLDELRRHHLLETAGPGRYRFHSLVLAYAQQRAADLDPPRLRRAALGRLSAASGVAVKKP